jgi:hypothetical protein
MRASMVCRGASPLGLPHASSFAASPAHSGRVARSRGSLAAAGLAIMRYVLFAGLVHYLERSETIRGRTHARKAIVMARYTHWRWVFGPTRKA